jgi:hypothetical protein
MIGIFTVERGDEEGLNMYGCSARSEYASRIRRGSVGSQPEKPPAVWRTRARRGAAGKAVRPIAGSARYPAADLSADSVSACRGRRANLRSHERGYDPEHAGHENVPTRSEIGPIDQTTKARTTTDPPAMAGKPSAHGSAALRAMTKPKLIRLSAIAATERNPGVSTQPAAVRASSHVP